MGTPRQAEESDELYVLQMGRWNEGLLPSISSGKVITSDWIEFLTGEKGRLAARGQGVASLMCEHSQCEAKRLGFCAMQFNLVVSTNEHAVRLWQKLGYAIVGTLPGAFKHPRYGFVDAFVMYKRLET